MAHPILIGPPLLATALAGVGVYYSFEVSNTVGYTVLVTCVIGLPVVLILGMKCLIQSKWGQMLFLRQAPAAAADACPLSDALAEIVGQTAVAECELRPAGFIRIGEHRYDARSEFGLIKKGTIVTILRAGGTDVVVRPLESTEQSTET